MSAPAPAMFTPEAKAIAADLGLVQGKANLDIFAETLLELARSDRNIVAVTSDSRGSGKLSPFAKELPNQLVEVGIAEQNLVGVAAGLASCGKKAFAVSPACFLTSRSLEQVKVDAGYSNNPVRLVGISAGVSYGALGSTHHSLHDIAALRAIHNIPIVIPADNLETREAIRHAVAADHPVYLRFGKAPMYELPTVAPSSPTVVPALVPECRAGRPSAPAAEDGRGTAAEDRCATKAFTFGKARLIRDGGDIAILATGETVIHAVLAAGLLTKQGVSCRVVSMHTIKPLDTAAVLACARDCRALLTVEEHSIHGGLGEAVAAVLLQAGKCVLMRILGIPDEYTFTGSQADIFRYYGLTMEGIAGAAKQLLGVQR